MKKVVKGDKVKIHFTLKLENGALCSSSIDDAPMEIVVGSGRMSAAFEDALVGMHPGEKRTFKLPADKALGRKSMTSPMVIPREKLPDDLQPEIGQKLYVNRKSAKPLESTVTDISERNIRVNAIHPLEGEDLELEILLLDIL